MLAEAGRRIREVVADAIAILLPVHCSGCGRADRPVCATCAARFSGAPVPGRTRGGLPVLSATRYDGEVARIITAFKDDGRTDAARVLGAALARTLRSGLATHPPPADTIVVIPVPSSRAAYRRRGYVPIRAIAAATRLPLTAALVTRRAVVDQATLGRDDRARNLAGALAVDRPLRGAVCVIIDDVTTTGATLDEAARALSDAGAIPHLAVTVAATPRRYAPKQGPQEMLSE